LATPYNEIHNRALARFSDYDILKFYPDDRERILDRHLMSAVSEFQRVCKIDLSLRNEDDREFEEDLTDEVMEILASGEAYYWVLPKVTNTENMRNLMSTKDYSFFSPAKLLEQLQILRTSLKDEFRHRMIDYTYREGKISQLKV